MHHHGERARTTEARAHGAARTCDVVSRGALAGIVGTIALTAFEPIERRILGHVPPHALPSLASRMPRLSRSHARLATLAMRWTYGPLWGALFVVATNTSTRAAGSARRIAGGAALAASIWAFELLTMPVVGLVPPVRRWRRAELLSLAAHTLAFGLATSFSLAIIEHVQARHTPAREKD